MKKHLIAAATLALAASLPIAASAQGRHDEKPHGVMTSSVTAQQDKDRPAATGGRHDSGGTTHGMKKTKKGEAVTEQLNKDK